MRERLRRLELCAGIIRSWAEPSPLLAAAAGTGVAAAAPGTRGTQRHGAHGDSWCRGRASATAWAHKGKGGRSPCGLPGPGVPVLSLLPFPKAKMAGPGEDLGQQWS